VKLFERLSKKVAKTASTAVKEEVKEAAIDLIPTLLGIGGAIIGLLIFRKHVEDSSDNDELPQYSNITITTNNYYIGNDVGRRMLKNEDQDG